LQCGGHFVSAANDITIFISFSAHKHGLEEILDGAHKHLLEKTGSGLLKK